MPTNSLSRHAVVLGAGIAGLLAACVLSDHFQSVTVIERDTLPTDPEFRSGVPQSHHVHGLLMRGLNVLERFFPGFDADLAAAGAPRVEWMIDTIQLIPTGWTPRYHSGIVTRACSRTLLESLIRRRIAALPNISFQDGSTVAGLVTNPDRSRVIGVRLQTRGGQPNDVLRADFVVDATGRGSHTQDWLLRIGYPAPDETVIDAHLGYASRFYRLPADFDPGWKALLIMPTPERPRGGVFQLIEDGLWVMTLAGTAGDYPPTDEAEMLAFAHSIPVPPLHQALALATPVTPIYGYRSTANRLHHYEALSQFPEGFAVMGDAACVFNPQYGQGMTTAALGAEVLDQCLRAGVDSLTFQQRLARSNQAAWQMAVNSDYRYPVEGKPASATTKRLHRYIDWLFVAAPSVPQVASTFLGVMHMMQPSTALFHPSLIARRLAYGLRHKPAAPPEPSVQVADAITH